MQKIYENKNLYIEPHESEIPWLKIFTSTPFKELSDCPKDIKDDLYRAMEIIEKSMIDFYQPTKVNIAMFGNYLPHLHIHVMARYEDDSFFPEPMWGKKQRNAKLNLPPFKEFLDYLLPILEKNL